MVLEATVVCIDNSEWMRNGDYPPSRLDAQQDAVNLICSAKIDQNRESSVGLLTMAGKSARILVTQTNDDRNILTSLHQVSIDGECDFVAGIRKAQLALKHRQNQQQRQRIIVFVGSPIQADENLLKKVGKDLKKNGVAVDFVSFGEEEQNSPKLEAFLQSVNSGENSHLVTVPTGPHILSEVLLRSPIISEESGAGPSSTGAADGSSSEFPYGVDPRVDPELALALSLSIEEERERQARAASQQAAAEGNSEGGDTKMEGTTVAQGAATDAQVGDDDLYGATRQTEETTAAGDGDAPMDADEDEMDENMRLAIQLSIAEQQKSSSAKEEDKKDGEPDKE
mmetsp:Transcript_7411/g.22561  ORF Transcript_7411/g.22561 Transcript_7411/m.22561 type:complete len:340 (+) Transcript_7411:101-1120(+)|eukprot:CAMPEP_0198724830 /NCGR_PEP_ID=MMETSP1475-20131203/2237_1 /TAXON_ID= ORGANISM="Unidentified sp., Strain CCMP1999" /NCGR_SAMPLE_ID=MMETSP1475 /ASSEMBLY_ACC=CAM_ASM_001111 /LENGTH=339 /DNA_ID=CAMNT_0044486457 /DNA_START=78 /DNA_END=1097 /DNA_ORIENTATION=-